MYTPKGQSSNQEGPLVEDPRKSRLSKHSGYTESRSKGKVAR